MLFIYVQETPNLKAFGNPYSATDAANLLKLLKALRSALGVASIISAAVGRLPWIGEDGFASTDVSEFSEQLSFINIMYVFVRFLCTIIGLRENQELWSFCYRESNGSFIARYALTFSVSCCSKICPGSAGDDARHHPPQRVRSPHGSQRALRARR